jgi:hypothetical protein
VKDSRRIKRELMKLSGRQRTVPALPFTFVALEVRLPVVADQSHHRIDRLVPVLKEL